jgi:hypothetical protein
MTRATSAGASRMNRERSSSARSLDDATRATGALRVSKIQIFVSFDIEHDGELFKLLLAQSGDSSPGFEVLGGSERLTSADVWSESVRRRIRKADQMIVICGEHTGSSPSVSAELRIAREEQTPYFLLWGRREIMCTKPIGAKSTEGMYNWTRQILQDQITFTSRRIGADVAAEIQRNSNRQGRPNPSGVAPRPVG